LEDINIGINNLQLPHDVLRKQRGLKLDDINGSL
jgi:hypothetical protein